MKYILIILSIALILSMAGCVSNDTPAEAEKTADEAGYKRGYEEGTAKGYKTGYEAGWEGYKEELKKPEGSIIGTKYFEVSLTGRDRNMKIILTVENVGGDGAISTGIDVHFTDSSGVKRIYSSSMKLYFKTGQQRDVELSFSIPVEAEWSYSKWCNSVLPE